MRLLSLYNKNKYRTVKKDITIFIRNNRIYNMFIEWSEDYKEKLFKNFYVYKISTYNNNQKEIRDLNFDNLKDAVKDLNFSLELASSKYVMHKTDFPITIRLGYYNYSQNSNIILTDEVEKKHMPSPYEDPLEHESLKTIIPSFHANSIVDYNLKDFVDENTSLKFCIGKKGDDSSLDNFQNQGNFGETHGGFILKLNICKIIEKIAPMLLSVYAYKYKFMLNLTNKSVNYKIDKSFTKCTYKVLLGQIKYCLKVLLSICGDTSINMKRGILTFMVDDTYIGIEYINDGFKRHFYISKALALEISSEYQAHKFEDNINKSEQKLLL